jgi:hypothetical protein
MLVHKIGFGLTSLAVATRTPPSITCGVESTDATNIFALDNATDHRSPYQLHALSPTSCGQCPPSKFPIRSGLDSQCSTNAATSASSLRGRLAHPASDAGPCHGVTTAGKLILLTPGSESFLEPISRRKKKTSSWRECWSIRIVGSRSSCS